MPVRLVCIRTVLRNKQINNAGPGACPAARRPVRFPVQPGLTGAAAASVHQLHTGCPGAGLREASAHACTYGVHAWACVSVSRPGCSSGHPCLCWCERACVWVCTCVQWGHTQRPGSLIRTRTGMLHSQTSPEQPRPQLEPSAFREGPGGPSHTSRKAPTCCAALSPPTRVKRAQ